MWTRDWMNAGGGPGRPPGQTGNGGHGARPTSSAALAAGLAQSRPPRHHPWRRHRESQRAFLRAALLTGSPAKLKLF